MKEKKGLAKDFLDFSCPIDWFSTHIPIAEVKEQLSKLKIKKSPCCDHIRGIATKSSSSKACTFLALSFSWIIFQFNVTEQH